MLAKGCEPQNPPERLTTIQPRLTERPGTGTGQVRPSPAQRPQSQQRSTLGKVNTFPCGLRVPKAEEANRAHSRRTRTFPLRPAKHQKQNRDVKERGPPTPESCHAIRDKRRGRAGRTRASPGRLQEQLTCRSSRHVVLRVPLRAETRGCGASFTGSGWDPSPL